MGQVGQGSVVMGQMDHGLQNVTHCQLWLTLERVKLVMGHGSHGSWVTWVSSLMGQIDHRSQNVSSCQLWLTSETVKLCLCRVMFDSAAGWQRTMEDSWSGWEASIICRPLTRSAITFSSVVSRSRSGTASAGRRTLSAVICCVDDEWIQSEATYWRSQRTRRTGRQQPSVYSSNTTRRLSDRSTVHLQ